MDIKHFHIQGPALLTPVRHGDDRGYFSEHYNQKTFRKALGLPINFIQDNHAFSVNAGTLRGLHYQAPPHAQAKLVSCLAGAILDIIVDIRRSSPTYGQHISVELSGENQAQLWVPEGFLHGYITRTKGAHIFYKVNAHYHPQSDGAVLWSSPALGLDWDGGCAPILSEKDQMAQDFNDFVSPFD